MIDKKETEEILEQTPAEPIEEPEKAPKKRKFFQKRKFKHGAYAIAATAIFIAVLIGFNIVATVMANRFPLHLDLTAEGSYTITPENAEYIRKLSRDVTITLCATKDDYTGGTYSQILQNSYISDSSGGVFFNQTVFLLEEYDRMSSHVTFVCADPQDPSFAKYTQAYPDESFSYGDVLVESNFELGGEKVTRHRRLTLEDLYTITNSSYSYSITASTVETAVTSAIYAITSDKTFKIALLTANGGKTLSDLEKLASTLKPNNYEISEVDNLLTGEIPSDADITLIAAPTSDYTGDELRKIEDFLDLNGKRGKSLFYIADASQPELPNLRDFLAEWGFSLQSGVVYETDSNNYMPPYPTFVRVEPAESDFTKDLDSSNRIYLGMGNKIITKRFDANANRKVSEVLNSLNTSVLQPIGADDSWDPSTATQKGPFVVLAVSEDQKFDNDDYVTRTSRVIVLSGLSFIDNAYLDYGSVGNLEAIRYTLDRSVGREDSGVSFDPRTVERTSYSDKITQKSVLTMRTIFLGIVPLAILATGVVIWIRRRRL